MELTSIPIIVVICYLVGEIYKVIFNKKSKLYKLIPILVAILGGVLGVLIYYTNPEIILDAKNIWMAISIGVISGLSSTGTHQIIKQMFTKRDDLDGWVYLF